MATCNTLVEDALFTMSLYLQLRLHVMIYYPNAKSSLSALVGQNTY